MRENILAIRLADDEWNQISDMADVVRLPMSTYVRAFILTQSPPTPRAVGVTVEAVAALNRVGALLNQIARIGNISKSLSSSDIDQITTARERLGNIADNLSGGHS